MASRLIAVVILALAILPIANLLPGGETDPEYVARLMEWLSGTALCATVGVLVAFLTRLRDPSRPLLVRGRIDDQVAGPGHGRGDGAGMSFVLAVTVLAFALYAFTAHWVFSARPLQVDEIVQVMQARWLLEGRLWVSPPPLKEFFSVLHVVDVGDRVYGQFPVGGPAMLALGSLVRAEWLVGPAAGAGCVALFAALLPRLEPDASRSWLRGVTLLFALAPFGVFMFASHMNHSTTLLWLLVATLALALATERGTASLWWALLCGVALGIATTIRPLDAAAFALPAAAWLAWRARHGGRAPIALIASGIGIAVPILALLFTNAETTGSALRFGYDVLWGSSHSLGFHAAPWGPAHTPLRAIELVSLSLTRLSVFLLETPVPALLLIVGGVWASERTSRRMRALERYLLWAAALLVLGYAMYWHDGFLLGPRFYFPLLPLAVLWVGRLARHLPQLVGRTSVAWVGLRAVAVAMTVLAVVNILVIRAAGYRSSVTSMRLDVEKESRSAGITNALVLVKESWGARLVVRMWALGVSRPFAERVYRNSDACRLELTLAELERDRDAGSGTRIRATNDAGDIERRLLPLLADSALIDRSARSDGVEAVVPGRTPPAQCTGQRESDRLGSSHLLAFKLARDGNVYARWLPGREAEISGLYPGRPVYLLERTGPEPEAGVRWRPIDPPTAR